MFISSGDIALRLIVKTDLELIRTWRNLPEVAEFMQFREFIDAEDQKQWFTNLNPQTDFFFLLFKDEIPVGVINLKHVNWTDKTAEAGIFIGEEGVRNTGFPVRATVLLMKLAFCWFGVHQLYAKVSGKNTSALQMNHVLGYRKFTNFTADFENYVCSSSDFLGSRILHTVGKMYIELFPSSQWLLKKVKSHPDFQIAD